MSRYDTKPGHSFLKLIMNSLMILGVIVASMALVAHGQNQGQTPEFLKSLQARRVTDPGAFFYDYNKPTFVVKGAGGQVRPCSIDELPTLAGQGISLSIVDMDPCSINLPHIHPRATEFLFISKADALPMSIGFIEENGGRIINNEVKTLEASIFPMAMVHFEFNPSCEKQQFLAAFSSDDPGVDTSSTAVMKMPPVAVASTFQISIAEAQALIAKQLGNNGPFPGEAECKARCGIK